MDLREIGAMLREERERQGLSLDVVSDKIKITRTCLTAIEDGNERALPHPVYAKGFIKNYARLLGVDHEDFTRGLTEIYKIDEPQLQEIPVVRDIPDDDCGGAVGSGSHFPVRAVVVALAGLLVLAGLGWYLYARVFTGNPEGPAPEQQPAASAPSDQDTASKPAPVVPVVPVAPALPEAAPAAPGVAPEAVAAPATPASQPAAAAAPEAKPSAPTPALSAPTPTPEDRATQDIATSGPAATSAPAVPPAQDTAPSLAAPGGRTFTVGETGAHTVSIVANDRCWLQAGADGGAMHETMLEKGDAFLGRFADYLLVRLGNAGGVEIRFDNKLYPLQVGKSSVKTLKFVAKKGDDEAAKAADQPGQPAAPAVAPPAPGGGVPATAAPGAETAQGPREVEIFGQDGSWVIVIPDKGPAKEVYVKKGQRITMPFGEKIEIKLGNPSNVVFRYDGKETPVTTEKGESKSIRFP